MTSQTSTSAITVDTDGHPRQGTSMALADRLDHPEANALRYAPSMQLDIPHSEACPVLSKV